MREERLCFSCLHKLWRSRMYRQGGRRGPGHAAYASLLPARVAGSSHSKLLLQRFSGSTKSCRLSIEGRQVPRHLCCCLITGAEPSPVLGATCSTVMNPFLLTPCCCGCLFMCSHTSRRRRSRQAPNNAAHRLALMTGSGRCVCVAGWLNGRAGGLAGGHNCPAATVALLTVQCAS